MLVSRWVEARMTTGESVTLSQDPQKALLTFGGAPTASGVPLTEANADSIPAVYAAINFRANTLGQVPLVLYREQPDGGRARVREHPLYTLLHDLANPEMSAFDFKVVMQRWLYSWGNAYAEIVRDDQGRVLALWPLRSDRMVVDRDYLNRLRYTYRLADGSPQDWLFDYRRPPILHLRINSLDGITGRSPIRVVRESLGLAKALEQHGARYFGQSSLPNGWIQGPKDVRLNPDLARRIRDDWERLHRGLDNAHRVGVLEQGFEFKPVSLPNDDAQFLESRKFQIEEVARIFDVPPHVLHHLDRATFNNIEHLGIELVTLHMMPDFVNWEQAISRDLISVPAFSTHYAQFNVTALLRGDVSARNNAYQVQRQNGVINANDWRRLEDMNPISAEVGGDAYLVNGNMVPIVAVLNRPPNEPAATRAEVA